MLHSRVNHDLVLYDSDELGGVLGEPVVGRSSIGEWPLSWAQQITLASGKRAAYKAMLPPLIEPDFYASAANSLLPDHRRLGDFGDCSTVLIDWIESPSLAELKPAEREFVTHARSAVQQISTLPDDLPVYLDVGTPERWQREAGATLVKLRQLIADQRFRSVTTEMADRVERWSSAPQVLDQVAHTSRVVHRDLKPEHVFPVDGGYRVIDWQVPARAPREIDLVDLLEEAGIDSRPYVDPATYGVAFFLNLRWATVAQHDFFPDWTDPLFDRWAAESMQSLLSVCA